jgi:signal transduction histidine kinase
MLPRRVGSRDSGGMDRALAVLAGGALLVVLVEAGAGDAEPAALAVALACAFAVLSVLGYRWAQARGRAAASTYVIVQLVLGFVLFDVEGEGVGATLLLLVLVIQAVLLLPRAWAIAVAAVVPLFHLGMSWPEGPQQIAITAVVVAFAVVLAALYLDGQQARTALAAANDQLRRYAAQAESTATTAERNRLAREIHDGLGHHLTVVQMQVRAARAVLPTDRDRADTLLDKAEDQSREALAEVRRSVGALREPWEAGPVADALAALAGESAGVTAALEVRGEPRGLSPDTARALYRAAQEALTNVRKHAGVDRARLLLDWSRAGVVRLQVRDEGAGLPDRPGSGYGLTGVRERVGQLGGTVQLRSAPGQGVTMTVELPG